MIDTEKNKKLIRKRAESVVALQNHPLTKSLQHISLEETQKIVHEFEVHQIELELQNEELLRTQIELEATKERYFDLYDMAPVGYCTLNSNGFIQEINFAVLDLLGKERTHITGKPFSSFIFAEDQDTYYIYRKKLAGSDKQEECELRIINSDETPLWISLIAVEEQDRVLLIIKDISERKIFEDKLELSASVFTNTGEAIMITELDGTISDVNESFVSITGYTKEEVIGTKPSILTSGKQNQLYYQGMWTSLLNIGSWKGEIWNKRKDGEVYPEMLCINTVYDYHGEPKHYVALFSDISEVKEYEETLKHIAHYDQLTKLPNRVLLADRLLHGISQTKRNHHHLAVIFLDLDGFKEVNDMYGHDVGDKLLVELAKKMKQELREGDTLARIGGDEFVAVLFDLEEVNGALPIITRLLDATTRTIKVDELFIQISASLGVTFYPQHEITDADQLLRQADQAMYQAKLSGKSRYHIFDAEENNLIKERFEGIEQILHAFKKEELELYYQPKVNMRTGEIVGVEALMRWNHPTKGLISPLDFLPVIEGHVSSIEIGEWVIESALKQIKIWKERGINIPISVNTGARQLLEEGFEEYLESILSQYPTVEPHMLEIEVLESSKLEDMIRATDVMNACRSLGITFSLDDFGTGYSSLIYLKSLPIKQIKIDQGFVREMLENPYDLSILEGIISLSKSFGMSVIAEGVETSEHAMMLVQLGCDLGQGYVIARPMPASEFPSWVKNYISNKQWQEQKLLNPLERQIFSIKVQHHAWIKSVKKSIMNLEMKPIKQHCADECYFGKWLESSGKEYLGKKYKEVLLMHTNIHQFADKLFSLHREGNTEKALDGLKQLDEMEDSLLKNLS